MHFLHGGLKYEKLIRSKLFHADFLALSWVSSLNNWICHSGALHDRWPWYHPSGRRVGPNYFHTFISIDKTSLGALGTTQRRPQVPQVPSDHWLRVHPKVNKGVYLNQESLKTQDSDVSLIYPRSDLKPKWQTRSNWKETTKIYPDRWKPIYINEPTSLQKQEKTI